MSSKTLSATARAFRALARSDLGTLRIPEDLPRLRELGFPEDSRSALSALRRLGVIRPVSRGLYEVRDATGTSRSSFATLLAARLVDAPHLATGWWALARAGLTNQDVREVVVLVVTKRRDLRIAGRTARMVAVAPADLWGGDEQAGGLMVARPERALCDVAGRRAARIPAARVSEALENFLDEQPDAVGRLSDAVKRFGSLAAARRLGYLTELIAGPEAAQPLHDFVAGANAHRADPLDKGDERAPIVTRWQVRTALAPEELLEHRRVS